MSGHVNAASRGSAQDEGPARIFVVAFILAGVFFAPLAAVAGPLALGLLGGYVYLVGPPLDFGAPHDGQVVVHIDVLGKQAPDIARIRITEVASGVTVWDVTPTTAQSQCWNGCWNLTLKAGANPASFVAGHQQFIASVPRDPSFSLRRGTAYLCVVWDSRGRVAHERFTL
jgi:hypothetical protein